MGAGLQRAFRAAQATRLPDNPYRTFPLRAPERAAAPVAVERRADEPAPFDWTLAQRQFFQGRPS